MDDPDLYPQIEKIVIWFSSKTQEWDVTLAKHGTVHFLQARDVLSYRKFQARCADALGVVFMSMKTDDWLRRVNAARSVAEERIGSRYAEARPNGGSDDRDKPPSDH